MNPFKEDYKRLEETLHSYNKIKKSCPVHMKDLIRDGYVLEIHHQLLRDASAYSANIQNSEELAAHRLAKTALMLWARIYCGKTIRARYKYNMNDNINEKIHDGIMIGVVKCFESIRSAVNEHFALPENSRKPFLSKGKTIRDYMLICVGNKVKTELGRYYSECLTEISPEKAEQQEKEGESIYHKNGRFYVGKFLPLEISDEDGATYSSVEVMEKITMDRSLCADEMLQAQDVKKIIAGILEYMRQEGILNLLEWEFISRCFGFRGEPEKPADIARDWNKHGKNFEGENLYNFQRSILKKIQKTMQERPEWMELSYRAAA